MLEKLIRKFSPYTKAKYILIGFALMAFINIIAFPHFVKELKALAPDAAGPIDLEFSYSPDKVYQMIETYSEEGRTLYIKSTLGIDVPYPVIYTITYILLLLLLFKKVFPTNERIHPWALLPLIIFVADMLENTGIILMLKNFPERLDTVARIGSVFTSIKWTFVIVCTLLILFLGLKAILQKNEK